MLHRDNIKTAIIRTVNRLNLVDPPLKVSDVTFGIPTAITSGIANTQVNITASNSVNYTGSSTVIYYRELIGDYLLGCKIPGKMGDYPTTRLAIAAMIEKYGFAIETTYFELSNINATSPQVTFKIVPDNLMFVPGSEVTLSYE